jgi:hypothetical protein
MPEDFTEANSCSESDGDTPEKQECKPNDFTEPNTCSAVEEESYSCQAGGAAGLSAGFAALVLAVVARLA